MKKLVAIGILVCSLCLYADIASAYTIKRISSTPNYNNSMDNAYCNDLTQVEEYIFGKSYRNEDIDSRLKRIEKNLFNKTYTTMNTTNRMNNILTSYRSNSAANNTSNFVTSSPFGSSSYYTRSGVFSNYTPSRRLYNRFIGQPTGFTPPIMNTPFHRNSFRPGYRSYYRPRHRYRNSYYRPRIRNTYGTRTYYGTPSYLQPTSARAGITILD